MLRDCDDEGAVAFVVMMAHRGIFIEAGKEARARSDAWWKDSTEEQKDEDKDLFTFAAYLWAIYFDTPLCYYAEGSEEKLLESTRDVLDSLIEPDSITMEMARVGRVLRQHRWR